MVEPLTLQELAACALSLHRPCATPSRCGGGRDGVVAFAPL